MQPKIAKEITFLKNFRNRFKYVADYKAALEDMLKEGLITELAYKEVLKPFKTTSPLKTPSASPKIIKKEPNNTIPVGCVGSISNVKDPCLGSHYGRNPCL